MAQQALGMIEVVGLVPALAAGDAAAKAANVTLLPLQKSPGRGLVTIFVQGEVAAVAAAVDAGSTEARRVGTLVSTHVIARPAETLDAVVGGLRPAEAPAASGGRQRGNNAGQA